MVFKPFASRLTITATGVVTFMQISCTVITSGACLGRLYSFKERALFDTKKKKEEEREKVAQAKTPLKKEKKQ